MNQISLEIGSESLKRLLAGGQLRAEEIHCLDRKSKDELRTLMLRVAVNRSPRKTR